MKQNRTGGTCLDDGAVNVWDLFKCSGAAPTYISSCFLYKSVLEFGIPQLFPEETTIIYSCYNDVSISILLTHYC